MAPLTTDIDWDAWAEPFAAFHARFAPSFFRHEVRERSARYLQALLGPVERKNGWGLAEAMGEADPNGAQRLLFEAVWDAEAVRDELIAFVRAHFSDGEPGILVLDETGFVKKGTKSVGVKHQYCGAVGKLANCQIGVFLTAVSAHGYAYLDRRLYLPEVWADDAARRAEAGVPEDVTFQTKPQLGQAMLAHAWDLGVEARWVTADSVYGSDGVFRRELEGRSQAYVLGIRGNVTIWHPTPQGPSPVAVSSVVAQWPETAWHCLSAGDGTKGPRWYDWAWQPLPYVAPQGWARWLLARRSRSDPEEVAYFFAFAPAATTLAALVRVAGTRWTIEQCFEEAKGETGLDHYQVRSWPSWHRHITLALLAHAFLAWMRQQATVAETPETVGEKPAVRSHSAPHGAPGRLGPPDGAGGAPPARDHVTAAGTLAPGATGLVTLAPAPPRTRRAQSLSPTSVASGTVTPYLRL